MSMVTTRSKKPRVARALKYPRSHVSPIEEYMLLEVEASSQLVIHEKIRNTLLVEEVLTLEREILEMRARMDEQRQHHEELHANLTDVSRKWRGASQYCRYLEDAMKFPSGKRVPRRLVRTMYQGNMELITVEDGEERWTGNIDNWTEATDQEETIWASI